MNKKIVVLQEDMKDCAPACVSSIIKYYGGYMDLESIRKTINTTKMGTNAYDIVNGVKELGFDSYAVKLSLDKVLASLNSPVILHVKKNNYYHFIVVYKVQKDKITIMDPSLGLKVVSYKELNSIYLGVCIKLVKEKELPLIKNENHLLKILIKLILKNKITLVSLFILSLILFITSLTSTYIYKVIIDKTSQVKELILIFILIVSVKYIIDFIRNIILLKLNKKIDISLNKELFKRVFNLPYSYYKNRTTGELLSRFVDLDSLKQTILDIIVNTILYIMMILGTTILLLSIDTKILMITLIILILYIITTFIVYNHNDKLIKIIQEEKGLYNNLLIESIEGLETINNLNLIEIFKNKLHTYYKHLIIKNNKLNIYNTKVSIVLNYLLELGNILILYIGIIKLNNNILTIGQVMLSYVLYNYLISILKDILNKVPDIKYGLKNIEKINTFLKYEETKEISKNIDNSIVVNNLSYGNYYKILNNLSFEIKSNDKVLLSGESGCGKSTLLKIILKCYEKYEGIIKIGSTDLNNISKSIIRNNFTYVGQNEKIFNDTIINNIKLDRSVNPKLLNDILDITYTKDIIRNKGLKEQTYIEENGFNLSGGERQRIILARALIDAKKFIFIDEALSEVDYELEKKIVKNILEYFKDNTIIYVSHKNQIKELFNKNIVLKKGENNESNK